MTTSDPTDDEEFCSRCAAGVNSPEHHEKCVVTGFAEDGESASDPRETEHIECDCVPDIGPSHCHLCSERAGHPVPWSEAHPDGAPGDHAELIARLGELAGRLVGFPGWHDVHDTIAALRTEQSARQAAEKEMHARELHHFEVEEENDALQQRIDAALKLKHGPFGPWDDDLVDWASVVTALTAPTESKEPTPKLDPEPWNAGNGRGNHAWTDKCVEAGCKFKPRPEFSQNPADYGIEAPHE